VSRGYGPESTPRGGTDEDGAMSDPSDRLWNEAIGPTEYSQADERYHAAVLEQYKLCVEMADRVSTRRCRANTYFLTSTPR
jgi:hypothetical protein